MIKEDPIYISDKLKAVLTLIDRVGFPILAYLLMFYMATISIREVSDALHRQTETLSRLVTAIETLERKS